MEVFIKDPKYNPKQKYKVISIRKIDDKTFYEVMIKHGQNVVIDAEKCFPA